MVGELKFQIHSFWLFQARWSATHAAILMDINFNLHALYSYDQLKWESMTGIAAGTVLMTSLVSLVNFYDPYNSDVQ